jgi:DNA (cytosine-5)-methyltransferase 1
VNELHLFAGAGGGILGGHLLGHTCVCAVEWNPYARRVLLARQRDGVLPRFPIWDDVQTFDGRPWQGRVNVVCGGFPCQDISAAGKGAGIDGERSGMWRHMARIISEVRPQFAFVENSPILTSRGLGVVLGDLAALGYDAEWCVLGASDAGAPHRRERIWILAADAISNQHESGTPQKRWASSLIVPADTASGRPQGRADADRLHGYAREKWTSEPIGVGSGVAPDVAYASSRRRPSHKLRARRDIAGLCSQDVADADSTGRKKQRSAIADGAQHKAAQRGSWWGIEPNVGRVANGVAARVDRLRCIGNGQVPAVAALAWETLMERIQNRQGLYGA